MFSFFFFFFFFSFLFILIVWIKMTHVPWRKCTRFATWMVWPTGLDYLLPSYLCPGGARRGGCWTGKYYIVHLSPPLLRLRGVGGGEGVRTSLVGMRTICAWDWSSYLRGAWTSSPECVTC